MQHSTALAVADRLLPALRIAGLVAPSCWWSVEIAHDGVTTERSTIFNGKTHPISLALDICNVHSLVVWWFQIDKTHQPALEGYLLSSMFYPGVICRWNSNLMICRTSSLWLLCHKPYCYCYVYHIDCYSYNNLVVDGYLVGGLEHFYFSIYWEFHHPNWLIFFRGVAQRPASFTLYYTFP